MCGDGDAYAEAEAAMAALDPAPRPIVSHLGPAVFDLRNANPFTPAGILFRFPLLHVDRPSRAELLRAFVENVAFAIRGNCVQLAAVAGMPARRVLVSGGLSRSPTVLRIVATALAVPLEVAEVPDSACVGSAILAAVATGLHADVPSAVAAMVRRREVHPESALVPAYDEHYHRWREWYDRLVAHTLA